MTRDREMGNHMHEHATPIWEITPDRVLHLHLSCDRLRVISIFQPALALANSHVDRGNCISHRGFRGRTLVEGLFSLVFFSLTLTLVTPL